MPPRPSPSAARAALPQLVRRDQLDTGNSLLATGEVAGQSFLGAPIGAALFAVAAGLPLLAAAGGYGLAAVLVLGIRRDLRPVRTGRTSVRADVGAGMRWLWGHRLLRGLTLLMAVTAFGLYLTCGVLVLYALDTLGLSEQAYGLPWLAAALFALAATAGTLWDVLAVSLRQALVPAELFGRVQGGYRTLVWGAMPLGAAGGGVLAALFGVPAVFVIGGAVNAVAAVGVWRLLRAHRREIDEAFGMAARTGVVGPE